MERGREIEIEIDLWGKTSSQISRVFSSSWQEKISSVKSLLHWVASSGLPRGRKASLLVATLTSKHFKIYIYLGRKTARGGTGRRRRSPTALQKTGRLARLPRAVEKSRGQTSQWKLNT